MIAAKVSENESRKIRFTLLALFITVAMAACMVGGWQWNYQYQHRILQDISRENAVNTSATSPTQHKTPAATSLAPEAMYDPNEEPDFTGPAAFIMETHPLDVPNLIPLMLHFASVLGPQWPIVLLALEENWTIPESPPFRRLVQNGQIRIRYLPPETSITDHHSVSVFLTEPWVWEQFETADRVLLFQSDSVICANSPQRMDDFLDWDLIGAPISENYGEGYNGGLSLRNPEVMLDIINDPDVKKLERGEYEDQWFFARAMERGAHLPRPEVAKTFAVETVFYDKPLGYHQPNRYQKGNISQIAEWCPEVGMLQGGHFWL